MAPISNQISGLRAPANHRATLKSQFEIEFEWTYLLHELTKEGDFLNFVSSFGPQVFDCGNREL